MERNGWLATPEGYIKAKLIEEGQGYRKVQLLGGAQDGRIEILPPEGTPWQGLHPAFIEGEDEPKVWRFKGRALRKVDLNSFPRPVHAKALLGTNQSFNADGSIKPYVFQPHTTALMDGILGADHIFLIGHKGVGKTSNVEQIAARIGQPLVRINFTGQVSVSDIVGNMGFGSQGTIWNDGPVITAMRNGYWLLLDEFDFGDPSVLSIFHPILEARPSYCLKENNGEVVIAAPGFRVFATGNSLVGDKDGQYCGTQAVNAALLDRFTGHGQVIEIKAMTAKQEKEVLLTLMPTLPHRLARRAAAFAADVRSKHLKGFSTRELINWCKKIMLYKDATRAAEFTFLAVIPDEATRKGIREFIRTRFGSRIIIGRYLVPPEGMAPGVAPRAKTPKAEAKGDEAKAETPTGGARTSSGVTDPKEMREIWRAYKGNGGAMSFEEIEKDPRFNLRVSRGMNAYRIIKKYNEMMGEGKVADEHPAEAKAEVETPKAPRNDEAPDAEEAEEDSDEDEADEETEEAEAETA